MHRTISTAFAFLVLLCCVLSCRNNNGTGPIIPEPGSSTFYGHVTNALGNPMDSVAVHYVPGLISTNNSHSLSKICPTTTIEFELPEAGSVTVKVFRYGTDSLMATLIDNEQLDAGMDEVSFDASRLTNGVYVYRVWLNGNLLLERRMLLIRAFENDLPDLIPADGLTYTDGSGNFKLPQSIFGIGVPFTQTNELGEVIGTLHISDTIRIVLYKPGHPIFSKTVIIDTNQIYYGIFRLQ